MSKRILISPNSYKECADSVTIAEILKLNLSSLIDAEIIVKPISDGGDGFLKVCRFYFGGVVRKYSISTAYDDSLFECQILYCENRQEIYVESAEVLGLKLIPKEYRSPLRLSSKGLGELLKRIEKDIQIKKINAKKVYIGIGGTATIDMGIGMMSELGLKLFDSTNSELRVLPVNFLEVKKIKYEPFSFSFEIITIVDVTNPLLGSESGIRVFGEQKGATFKEISLIEDGCGNLLNLFNNNKLQFFYDKLLGAGGGLTASFQIFYRTAIIQSNRFIENILEFDKLFDREGVDYLITGEGAYDPQSKFGKGSDVLINIFKSKVDRIFLICGVISNDVITSLPRNVIPIEISKYFSSKDESILGYREGLEKASKEIDKHIKF